MVVVAEVLDELGVVQGVFAAEGSVLDVFEGGDEGLFLFGHFSC